MLTILSLAFVTGIVFGLARFKVWALFPIIVVFLLATFVIGSSLNITLGRIALTLFVALLLIQTTYLIGLALSEMISDRLPKKQIALSAIQTAIAEELRAYFLPPDDLPRQLNDKLLALRYAEAAQ